nr:hypothetical protein [uncultured Flavobacterium sp.]
MKLFFLGLFFVLYSSVFSQKIYYFDYVLEYDLHVKKSDPAQKEYYYINSKDNSYKMRVVEKDSLNFKVNFLDVAGNSAVVYFSKADFLKATSITIPCKFIKYYSTSNLRTKDYSFSSLNDTVINGISYYHYVLKSKSVKREKKQKLSRAHYVLDKGSFFHFPFFFNTLDFEVWKKERSVINGIPFVEYWAGTVKDDLFMIRRLFREESINMQLVISDECDYEKTRWNVSTKIVNEPYPRQ